MFALANDRISNLKLKTLRDGKLIKFKARLLKNYISNNKAKSKYKNLEQNYYLAGCHLKYVKLITLN